MWSKEWEPAPRREIRIVREFGNWSVGEEAAVTLAVASVLVEALKVAVYV